MRLWQLWEEPCYKSLRSDVLLEIYCERNEEKGRRQGRFDNQ